MNKYFRVIGMTALVTLPLAAQADFIYLANGVARPEGNYRIELDNLKDGVSYFVSCTQITTDNKSKNEHTLIHLSCYNQPLTFKINGNPVAANGVGRINSAEGNRISAYNVKNAKYIDVFNVDPLNTVTIKGCFATDDF